MLTDSEVRRLFIELMTEETDRDRQKRVGASDIANQCDRCLAHKLLGTTNRDSLTDRYWLGRVIGTAVGLLAEGRADAADGLEPEKHVWFGDIPGYGRVGGSADLVVTDEDHILDYKGSWLADIFLLEDHLQRQGVWRVGEKPRFEHMARGNYKVELRTGVVMSLSAAEYEAGLERMAHKVTQYVRQVTLYMHGGLGQRASLVFFARDGNGGFDNPGLDRYEDPKAKHHVFVWSVDADPDLAEWLLERAGRIWAHLEADGSPLDFEPDPHCFPCGRDLEAKAQADIIRIFETTEEVAA